MHDAACVVHWLKWQQQRGKSISSGPGRELLQAGLAPPPAAGTDTGSIHPSAMISKQRKLAAPEAQGSIDHRQDVINASGAASRVYINGSLLALLAART